MGLLHLLINSPAITLPIKVVHINYHLRGADSDNESKLVAETCQKWSIPYEIHDARGDLITSFAPYKGVQAWARQIRQKIFTQHINDNQIVALAHHQDDLVENVLLRLAKGQSFRLLAGMSAFHQGFWRPLLKFKKNQIADYLRFHQVPFLEDQSNQDSKYERNYVRHEIAPRLEKLNRLSAEHIAHFAMETQDNFNFYHQLLASKFVFSEGLQIAELKGLSRNIGTEVIAAYFAHLGRSHGSRKILNRIWWQLEKNHFKCLPSVQLDRMNMVKSKDGILQIQQLDETQLKKQYAHEQHSKTPSQVSSFIQQ